MEFLVYNAQVIIDPTKPVPLPLAVKKNKIVFSLLFEKYTIQRESIMIIYRQNVQDKLEY